MLHIQHETIMHFFREKITTLHIGWNERPLSEADFYRLCKQFKIGVTEMPLSVGVFYYRMMGRDFIAVDSKLAGPQKLVVLFHELAHFLFHVPNSGVTANFHGVGHRDRKEIEADLFALCAVIPKSWIETRTIQELIEHEGYTREMIEERLAVLERYGI